jgi:eukaryotic-like serine/threonine-protein kinase
MLSQLLGERYQVVEVLSQGIFCQTYITQDTHLLDHPTCVVKHFLPSNQCPIPVEIRRRLFIREAEALKKLDNYDLVPHLLTYFEDNLEFYLVQEFIEGHPLSVELAPGHRWSESKVFQLLREILEILSYVHSHGLIHRDVKPSNIIRRKQDNRLVLIDFGAVKPIWNQLVREQGQTSIFIPLEYTTIAIGTPGYMPNEQERGRPRFNSDIYALGMIGIQALTGVHPTHLPEDHSTGEVIWQHLAQVNPQLASVLNKMVHYHFKDRYKLAQEVLEDLQPLTGFYTSTQESIPTRQSENVTVGEQTSSPEPDTTQLAGSKASASVSGNQIIDSTESETLQPFSEFYTPTQELAPTRPLKKVLSGSQNLLSGQDTNQTIGSKEPAPHSENQTIAPTVFLNKSALLIGLVIGVASGLILLVISYWFMQTMTPSKMESPPQLPEVYR